VTPAEALAALRAAEARDGRLTIAQRRDLLKRLAGAVLDRAEDFARALDADYGGRSRYDTLLADVLIVADAAKYSRRWVGWWARPRRAWVPYPFWPTTAAEEPVPKGVVGIVAPWNYPVQLALWPVVDAIAAGNRVCVKPSEFVPRTVQVVAEVLDAALGPDIARCVQGDAAVAADFCAQPWDHLMFTGGTATGRKVAEAAARNLVPVTLELGGKCPAVVLPGADLRDAARNILAGKAVNAGQTCIAPDTVLLVGHEVAAFEAACRAAGIAQPEGAVASDAQAARLDALARDARVTPLGADDGRKRAIALAEAPADGALSREEIFGPMLAVQPMRDIDEAIAWIAARPAPLAIYLFGATRAEEGAVAARTRSGALVTGRAIEYAAFPALGFGGVGASGMGRYHGRAGFLEFSDMRARVRHGRWSLSRFFDLPRKPIAAKLTEQLLKKR
jgi:acyl-CoA reductase-like NAD-dependent aldehyde dehydrogenase